MLELISTAGRGNYTLVEESRDVAQLKYKNWLSSTAIVSIDDRVIEIKPKNIWHSKNIISIDGTKVGTIRTNWKGHIIIERQHEDTTKRWTLKNKGFMKYVFKLYDEQNDVVLTLESAMNWKKLSYQYRIELLDTGYDIDFIKELVIYCGYGINMHLNMIAAGSFGAAG